MALTQASEEGLKISNAGTNGQYLQKQSGNAGGLTWADVPAGVGGATGVDFNDDVKARFGTGNDLEIYHNGTDSEIKGNTGSLTIKNANNLNLYTATNEDAIVAIANGAVELYYNGTKKLETTSGGANLEGSLVFDKGNSVKYHRIVSNDTGSDLAFQQSAGNSDASYTSYLRIKDGGDVWLPVDGKKLLFGAGNDLEIYHDGSDSYLKDTGTGSLYITGSEVKITNAAVTENIAKFIENGAVELYHDNSKKLETYSDGIKVYDDVWLPDDGVLRLGDRPEGGDLNIYHDGSHSYIDDVATGDLKIRSNGNGVILGKTDGENTARFLTDGAVELYYNNSKKIETTSGGAQVTGNMVADAFYLGDNEKLYCGTGDDLQIYHNGDHGYIKNTTGTLHAQADHWKVIDADAGDIMIQATSNSAVELYHSNSPRLQTTSDGVRIEGGEGSQAAISLEADQGDDNADKWQIVAQDGGDNAFSIKTLYTGSWATGLKILINSQDNPCIQAPKGGLRFDENNTHTTANFDSINGDGHLARIDGQAWLTADDYFRIRDLDNAEDKRFEFNTDSGNAGAMNDWQDDQFDFAEMFEWSDGNPDDEDRIGHTVAIDGVTGKIKIAQTGDTVIGVVSGTAAFTANCAGLYWHNAYLRDEWGRYKYRYITDDDGNTVYNDPDNGNVRPKKKLIRNPNWDQERSYHRRTDRKEWDKIGIIGQCYVRKTAVIPSTWIKLKEIDSTKDFYLIK